jgi:hypothetical protein
MPTAGKGRRFWTLYKKELRELTPEIVILIATSILLNVYAYFKAAPLTGLSLTLTVGLAAFLPSVGLAAFLPFISSFKLSREWKNQTVYLMMSLPASGALILGAKLTALMTELVIGGLAAGTAGGLAIMASYPGEIKQLMSMVPNVYSNLALMALFGLVNVMFFCCISFLAQVLGKLVRKYSGLLSFVSFIAILILLSKGIEMINAAGITHFGLGMGLNPPLPFPDPSSYILYSSVIIAVVSVLVFFIAALIYDRRLEL